MIERVKSILGLGKGDVDPVALRPESSPTPKKEGEDKWMEVQRLLVAMPDEEREALMAENRSDCICPTCPSYGEPSAEKSEALFCCEGKSQSIGVVVDCLCSGCEVAERMGMEHSRYCMSGNEREQRGL